MTDFNQNLNPNYDNENGNSINPNYNNENGNGIDPNKKSENENNINQNQSNTNQEPNYSFWAEQTNTYSGNTNSNLYSNPNTNSNNKRNKGGAKTFKFIAKAACFGFIAGICFLGVQEIYNTMNPDSAGNIIFDNNSNAGNSYEIAYTENGTVRAVSDTSISNVTKEALPSIVAINSTSTDTTQWFGRIYQQPVEGSGSGIVVGRNEEELLIATNNHVVEGTDKIEVTFVDGTKAEAIIKGTDATADLAVVTVDITALEEDTLNSIKVAKLGSSSDSKVGEMVIAIGNALGYGQSVTVGYVSALDRSVEVSNGYTSKKMVLLQTDAAINPGNSGGALINMNGEVIGINTVKYANNEVEGMGFAIPITKANPIINELMSREILSESEQGYIGITGTDVTEEIASYYNMPVGVYISEVVKDGAAETAGLMADDIIIKADDIEVSSISQLKEYVNSKRVGTKVEITYMRNMNGTYEEGEATVTLGQYPELNN